MLKEEEKEVTQREDSNEVIRSMGNRWSTMKGVERSSIRPSSELVGLSREGNSHKQGKVMAYPPKAGKR
jgi:hypothetical protein